MFDPRATAKSALKLVGVVVIALPALTGTAEKDAPFEGIVSAKVTRGGTETTPLVFTRKGNLLRIENSTNKLEPVNIADLAANKLTIVYPHNTTFVHVDLTKNAAQPAGPNLPPGFPTQPNISTSQLGVQIGPRISPPPGFPSPPPIGGAPALSNQMPAMRNNPMASGVPAMPMPPSPGFGAPGMPPMPAMGGLGGTPELKKTDQTKKIQGPIARYTPSAIGWRLSKSGRQTIPPCFHFE